MIRRSLRKCNDDDNKDKSDSDSENVDSESEEYIPSESEESETEEYKESAKKRKKNSIENDEIPNIKLDEKMLKNNVILVLNNSKFINDDDDDYNSNNEEEQEDDNINENDINLSANKKKYSDILVKYNRDEKKYFNNLNEEEKDRIYDLENNLKKNNTNDMPTRFKLLDYNINTIVKKSLIYNIEQLNCMCKSSSEYFKLHNWINTLSKIPIGVYNKLDIIK